MLPFPFFIQPFEWPCYGLDPGGSRYAQIDQIDRSNVTSLKQAWSFHTGEKPNTEGEGPGSNWEATPIMVDGTLFFPTPKSQVFAIDAGTGKFKWKYDPKIDSKYPSAGEPLVSRGVAQWLDPSSHRRKIYFATYEARLICLDAQSGALVKEFGTDGSVNLRAVLGAVQASEYTVSSPPTVIGDRIVVGSCISDNKRVDMPSGIVRAFEARTGKLVWTWDPLGRKIVSEPARPYLPGSANAWSIMSADPEKDLLFVPTGSQSPDFYGGLRPGDDRSANSVTALRASTGAVVWSFQAVHHDLWDYDVPAQPIVSKIGDKPVVIVMTKMGRVFLLDEMTGNPIFPVEERPAPESSVEKSSATQPEPSYPKPLVKQGFDESDVWAVSNKEKEFLLGKVKGMAHGMFAPPSTAGTVLFPGDIGGCNWSGGSFDPTSGSLFVNTNSIATLITLFPSDRIDAEGKAHPGSEIGHQAGAPYAVRREWFFAHGLVPGTKPPWGSLHRVELSRQTDGWSVPLGISAAMAERPDAAQFGSINLGGSFLTSTGLVFIAAATDDTLRAFEAATGKVLWSTKLPAGGNAAPMTYRTASGKQFVVICAGGHHGLHTTPGDSVVAFALP
jgi:quinoprotein glucose dehydrogenase